MSLLLCRQEPVKNPFYIEVLDIHIFSSQELCYVIFNHPLLVMDEFVDSALFDFIRQDLGLGTLADRMEKLMETGNFDLVITGEGQLNFQSVMGKLPVEIAKSAAKYGIKTTAVVGSLGEGWQKAERYFERIYTLKDDDVSVGYAITHAEELLEKTLKKVIKDI